MTARLWLECGALVAVYAVGVRWMYAACMPRIRAVWLGEPPYYEGELGRIQWSLSRQCRSHFLTRRAWLRATLDRHLLRYETEHCLRCGRRVRLVWWALAGWAEAVGREGGLRCPRCFDGEAQAVGVPVFWLAVTPDEFDAQVRAYLRAARHTA